MNAKELKDLIEFLIEKDVSEFELERGDMKMRLKRGSAAQVIAAAPVQAAPAYITAPPAALVSATPVPAPGPVASPAPEAEPAPAKAAEDADLHIVRSPIVGTFYESPSPGAAAFVKAGDTVENGQVLCIVEAMKLMNEIESDVAGTIVKRYLENGQPVEYGQPLFAVRA
jgi:acetyl-CoA carboxylase biotin carboxyl carrier protein